MLTIQIALCKNWSVSYECKFDLFLFRGASCEPKCGFAYCVCVCVCVCVWGSCVCACVCVSVPLYFGTPDFGPHTSPPPRFRPPRFRTPDFAPPSTPLPKEAYRALLRLRHSLPYMPQDPRRSYRRFSYLTLLRIVGLVAEV